MGCWQNPRGGEEHGCHGERNSRQRVSGRNGQKGYRKTTLVIGGSLNLLDPFQV